MILKSLLLLIVCGIVHAQQATVKQVPPKPTTSVAGKDLFQQYCAVCHGPDGKGNGPAAPAMKSHPTDLTQISRNNGGKFPEERIMQVLKGDANVTAHGNQAMPVWGKVFSNMSTNLVVTQSRMHGLVQYIDDMQAK
jgi:mono/diheme cytochrome c family protein